jgi:hypothetical protein
MAGFNYFVDGDYNGILVVKIGDSCEGVEFRIADVSNYLQDTGNAVSFVAKSDSRLIEKMLKAKYAKHRIRVIRSDGTKSVECFCISVREAMIADRAVFDEMLHVNKALPKWFKAAPSAEDARSLISNLYAADPEATRILVHEDRAGELLDPVREFWPNAEIVIVSSHAYYRGAWNLDLMEQDIPAMAEGFFDIVISNPPFTNGQEINQGKKNKGNTQYWKKAVDFASKYLKEDGYLGLIAPAHPQNKFNNYALVGEPGYVHFGKDVAQNAMSVVLQKKFNAKCNFNMPKLCLFPNVLVMRDTHSSDNSCASSKFTLSSNRRISIDFGQSWQSCDFVQITETKGGCYLMFYGSEEDLVAVKLAWFKHRDVMKKIFGSGQLSVVKIAQLFGMNYLAQTANNPKARKEMLNRCGIEI